MYLRNYVEEVDYSIEVIPGPTDEEWGFLERRRDFGISVLNGVNIFTLQEFVTLDNLVDDPPVIYLPKK